MSKTAIICVFIGALTTIPVSATLTWAGFAGLTVVLPGVAAGVLAMLISAAVFDAVRARQVRRIVNGRP